jgi:hypothetical protein
MPPDFSEERALVMLPRIGRACELLSVAELTPDSTLLLASLTPPLTTLEALCLLLTVLAVPLELPEAAVSTLAPTVLGAVLEVSLTVLAARLRDVMLRPPASLAVLPLVLDASSVNAVLELTVLPPAAPPPAVLPALRVAVEAVLLGDAQASREAMPAAEVPPVRWRVAAGVALGPSRREFATGLASTAAATARAASPPPSLALMAPGSVALLTSSAEAESAV